MSERKPGSLAHGTIWAEMVVNDKIIVFQLYSRASVNVLSAKHIHERNLKSPDKTLVMRNGVEMKPLSKCHVKLRNPKNRKKYAMNFVTVWNDLHLLLGAMVIQKMGLFNMNKEEHQMVAKRKRVNTQRLDARLYHINADEELHWWNWINLKETAEAALSQPVEIQLYPVQGNHLGTTSENQSKAANLTPSTAINPDNGRTPKTPHQNASLWKIHPGRIVTTPAKLMN